MGQAQAYRLIQAYQVIDNLSPIGEVLPQNESQARPLTRLSASDQRKFWRSFTDSGAQLKASIISRAVSAFKGRKKDDPKIDLTKIISSEYKNAVMKMIEQIRLAQNDMWKSTSRTAALYWNKVMKDKIKWKI